MCGSFSMGSLAVLAELMIRFGLLCQMMNSLPAESAAAEAESKEPGNHNIHYVQKLDLPPIQSSLPAAISIIISSDRRPAVVAVHKEP